MINPPTKIEEFIETYDSIPVMHTRRDETGQLYYCHWLDDDGWSVYAMTPITERELQQIKDGQVDLRDVVLNATHIIAEDHDTKFLEKTIRDYMDAVPDEGVRLK